jgi:hypothetical protein
MQDQGKRLLVAVALALGVLLVWNMFAHKDEPPKPKPEAGDDRAARDRGGADRSPRR